MTQKELKIVEKFEKGINSLFLEDLTFKTAAASNARYPWWPAAMNLEAAGIWLQVLPKGRACSFPFIKESSLGNRSPASCIAQRVGGGHKNS